MSFVDDLLMVLSSYHGGYRLMRRRMRGDTRPVFPESLRDTGEAVFRVTLSRLKKRGLVRNQKGAWFLTKKGIDYVAYILGKKSWRKKRRDGAAAKRSMIIVFDIPEARRNARDWLRLALADLGFHMLQKSVWLGPAPLPEEFIVSLKESKLLEHLKFFKAEEHDIV